MATKDLGSIEFLQSKTTKQSCFTFTNWFTLTYITEDKSCNINLVGLIFGTHNLKRLILHIGLLSAPYLISMLNYSCYKQTCYKAFLHQNVLSQLFRYLNKIGTWYLSKSNRSSAGICLVWFSWPYLISIDWMWEKV